MRALIVLIALDVFTKSGVKYTLSPTAVDAETVTGTVAGQTEPVRIAVADIDRVEVTEIDKQRTAILIVAVVAVVVIYAFVAANAAVNAITSVK